MKAIFLDRDGTIIEDAHYIREPEKVELVPNAVAGLKKMKEKGYTLFVVSNQSGVGRGIITDDQFKAVHQKVCEVLTENGIEISEYAYCFHRPEDHCRCRKPAPGLITRNFNNQPIDLASSFVVGDKDCDLELAQGVGAQPVLVLTGKGQKTLEELSGDSEVGARLQGFQTYPDLLAFSETLPENS